MNRTGRDIICPQCNSAFYCPGWAIKSSGGHGKPRQFCNRDCQVAWQSGKHHSPQTEIKAGQRIGKDTEFKKGQRPFNYIDGRDYERINSHKKKHRLIYEQYHKISLHPWIVIHHVDQNIHNNDISNLLPMTRGNHTKLHHVLRRTNG